MRFLLMLTISFSHDRYIGKAFPDGTPITVETTQSAPCRQQGALGSVITSWTYQVELNRTSIYGEKALWKFIQTLNFSDCSESLKPHLLFLGKKSTNIEQVKSV